MEDQQERFPKEKRRSPRVGGAVVEYFIDREEAPVKKAFIKDICIHGICIYMPEIVEEKKIVDMDIYLFGSETLIHAKGRVVWHKPGEYLGYHNIGIEFTEVPKEDKKKLSDHIKANYNEE